MTARPSGIDGVGLRGEGRIRWCVIKIVAVSLTLSCSIHALSADREDSNLEATNDEDRYASLMDLTDVELGYVDEEGYHYDVLKNRLFRRHFFELYEESDFNEAELRSLDRADLGRRYEAAAAAVFWTQSSKAIEMLENAFSVRNSRGDLSQREIGYMGRLYLRSRQFDRARSFQEQHGIKLSDNIPQVDRSQMKSDTEEGVPVWRIDSNADQLVLERLVLPDPLIVMTMGVGCVPSQEAMGAILNDAEMKRRFEDHGLLLHASKSMLDFDRMVEWNRNNDELEIVMVDMESDWPSNRHWGTPSFHFFKNGELVDHLIGWDDPETLRAAMERFFGGLH